MFGGFVTYTVYAQLGLPYFVGLIASAVTLAIVGALIQKFLFGPVIQKSVREESTMLLAAGIAFFLDAVILLLFGEKQRGVPKIVNGIFNYNDFTIVMPYDKILVGILAIAAIAGFILYMHYSKTGRAMRALAQDKIAAQLMGVNVERYGIIGFRARRDAGRCGRRPSGHHHRDQPRHGRTDLGQGLHDGDDRRRRRDFRCDRPAASSSACSNPSGCRCWPPTATSPTW